MLPPSYAGGTTTEGDGIRSSLAAAMVLPARGNTARSRRRAVPEYAII